MHSQTVRPPTATLFWKSHKKCIKTVEILINIDGIHVYGVLRNSLVVLAVSECQWVCIFPTAMGIWQSSGIGRVPRSRISIILQQRQRGNAQQGTVRDQHLPCSLCMTLAMSTDGRPYCLGEAMTYHGVSQWDTDADCGGPLCTSLFSEGSIPPSSLSTSLSLPPLSLSPPLLLLQQKVQSKARFHLGSDRCITQWQVSFHSKSGHERKVFQWVVVEQ